MANVVVIDDAQVNLVLMSALLGKLPDCNATSFLSPDEALEHCMREDPDLVIVDYMMPDMDGIEFIQRFRKHPGRTQTPLLMVTADHEREVRYRALESGANDFLTKPLDRIEFLSRVKNMLSLRRNQVALANHARTLAEEVRRANWDWTAPCRSRCSSRHRCTMSESSEPRTTSCSSREN